MAEIFIPWNQTLRTFREFQYLTRAENLLTTRLRIGNTKASKPHILSREPSTYCQNFSQTLYVDHIRLECAVLQQSRDGHYTINSFRTLFETISDVWIVHFWKKPGASVRYEWPDSHDNSSLTLILNIYNYVIKSITTTLQYHYFFVHK